MTEQDRTDVIKAAIRDVLDFPKPGIVFKDITPLLADPRAFNTCLDLFAERFDGEIFDTVVGIESRGFIFGAALASRMRRAFVPVRKPGKLPAETVRVSYDLEYGSDTIEIHKDAIQPGDRVLIVDDLLATGGTARAAADLVDLVGGKVIGVAFVVELSFLSGRDRLGDVPILSLVTY